MSEKTSQSVVQQNCYVISAEFNKDQLIAELNKQYRLKPEPLNPYELIYYDTFDWRLYQQGKGLLLRQQGQQKKLELEDILTGYVLAVAPMAGRLDVITDSDLEASALRQVIIPIIEMRAMLPVVRIAGNSQKVLLRDKHDKVVLRLSIEEDSHAWIGRKHKQAIVGHIRINPVKGFLPHREMVNTILSHYPGLSACRISLLDSALQAIGRQANDYSSKVKIKLKPDSQSVQAVKDILQHLLSAMERNEPGMLASLDSEFLHDYRVAVRRMRSLLSQMKNALPKKDVEFFRTETAWLGTLTTPARDLDVYLLEFPALQNSLPDEMHEALLPFREFVIQQQQQAYQEVAQGLASERYKKFKQAMQDFFRREINATDGTAPKAKQEIHDQAGERIWRCYRRVTKEAEQLSVDSPAQDFHELRKSCKKLRYLLEFFQNLYPGKDIARLITQLKGLQDNLGEFQDMDVQSHALHDFARQMAQQGVTNSDTFMAMGVLADGMEQRKKQLKQDFGECYGNFAREKYQKLFRKLFKPDHKPQQVTVHESVSEL